MAGCLICSSSVSFVGDCCFGDDGFTTGGGGGGSDGTTVGISTGTEGKTERTGDTLVLFVICKINY